MADKIFLELISPEKSLVSTEVDALVATAAFGEVGILPGHSAFLSSLCIGGFNYTINGEIVYVALSKGFMEVSDDRVIVLAENAEFGKDVDIQNAKELKANAEKMVEDSKDKEGALYEEAVNALKYQEARIEAFERSK